MNRIDNAASKKLFYPSDKDMLDFCDVADLTIVCCEEEKVVLDPCTGVIGRGRTIREAIAIANRESLKREGIAV